MMKMKRRRKISMTDFTLMMTKRFYEMHLHNLTQIIGIRKITKIICLKKIGLLYKNDW